MFLSLSLCQVAAATLDVTASHQEDYRLCWEPLFFSFCCLCCCCCYTVFQSLVHNSSEIIANICLFTFCFPRVDSLSVSDQDPFPKDQYSRLIILDCILSWKLISSCAVLMLWQQSITDILYFTLDMNHWALSWAALLTRLFSTLQWPT